MINLPINSGNNIIRRDRQSLFSVFLGSLVILVALYPFLNPGKANAAVTEGFVRFDRMATGSAISGTACLKSTLTTQTNVVILFPADWTIDSTTGGSNWTTSTTNLPVDPVGGGAATAWPGIGQATAVNGNSVTFPATALSSGTFYCFNFTDAVATVSTIGAAGNDKTGQLKTQGGSPFTDTMDYATSVVSSGADQITVTASVSATMTFSLSGSTVSLGTITSGSTASGSGITQTVTTNARNGWISWVKSGTDGGSGVGALHSAVANSDIVSPGTHNGTPETLSSSGGYVLDVDAGTGAPTIAAEYLGASADQGGHLDQSQFRQTATKTNPGASDTAVYVFRARASATQPAASDYSDTVTVVAAGSF